MSGKRLVVVAVLGVFGSMASFVACIDSSGEPPPPAGTGLDASFPDTSPNPLPDSAPPGDGGTDTAVTDSASCAVQASLSALGADAGGTVIASDFTCPAGIDLDASTATLDFTGSGFARAPQARALESAGDGGEGAYANDGGQPDDAGLTTLPAGTHAYSSFDLEFANAYVDGDLTIDVAGPFTLGNGSGQGGRLMVQGNVTIVASGPITICAEIDAAGDVTIHQPTNAGITFGCTATFNDAGYPVGGSIYAGVTRPAAAQQPALTATSPGDIDIGTRGPLLYTYGWMYSGAFGTGAQARSGNVTLRAYGDVTMGFPPNMGSYFYVGAPPCTATTDAGACTQYGTNGDMEILTEGTLTLDWGSYLYAGDSSHGAGGNLSLRGAAGVKLNHQAFVYAGNGGALDVLSQGDVVLDQGSYGYAGYDTAAAHDVTIRGKDVTIDNRAYLYAEGSGGSVAIGATGNVTVDHGAYLYASDAQCKPGGELAIRAGGDVAITNGAYTYAGNSDTGQGCTPVAGGNATVFAGGTIAAPVPDAGTPPLNAGTGSPAGTITQTAGAPVAIGLLDVQLEPSQSVVSLPMASGSTGLLFGAVGVTDPAAFFGAHVLVSPDGGVAAFAPVEETLGAPLAPGWRYEVLVQPRMFDPSAVDGVVVRVK
jgi:hypothetical protein